MRITKLERSEGGWLTANVTPEVGQTYAIHCKYGSWMRGDHGDNKGGLREIPRDIVAAVASKARTFEKAERKANGDPEPTRELVMA